MKITFKIDNIIIVNKQKLNPGFLIPNPGSRDFFRKSIPNPGSVIKNQRNDTPKQEVFFKAEIKY